MFNKLQTAYYIRKSEKTISRYSKALQLLPCERKVEVINIMTETIKKYIDTDNAFVQKYCMRMLAINIQTLIEMGYDTLANKQNDILKQFKG